MISKLSKGGPSLNDQNDQIERTMKFQSKEGNVSEVALILTEVYQALVEKGYNPLDQIVGYLMSGDPAYITSHRNARVLVRKLERDRIIDELVRTYLEREGL
jgi:uncharacterized protein (UPF0297 family)